MEANIIIISDNKEKLLKYGSILKGLSELNLSALSEEDALQHLNSQKFALIIIDYHSNSFRSVTFVQKIRNSVSNKLTPILFVSDEPVDEETRKQYSGLELVFFLSVPIDLQILKESEERFRLLAETAAEGIMMTDTNGQIVYANKRMAEILGYSIDELIGHYPWEFVPDVDKEDVINWIERELKGERTVKEVRKDGKTIWCQLSASPIMDGEKVIGLCWMFTDITERKIAEEKLKKQAGLLDKSSDGIFELNLDGKVEYVNRAGVKIFQISEEELRSGIGGEVLFGGNTIELRKAIGRVLKEGDFDSEITLNLDNNKTVVASLSWTLMRDESGNPESIFIIATDITEKKALEARLLQAQRFEALGAIASGIAHDLNNIFSPMLMAVEMIKDYISDPAGIKILDSFKTTITRGTQIVQQITTFVKGTRGNVAPVQMRLIVKEIVNLIKETFPKNITIVNNVKTDLWMIKADPAQMHQVLLNLSVNARDAMPDGGKLIFSGKNVIIDEAMAMFLNAEKTGPYVMISVEDTGCGIAENIIDKIFEPFFTTKDPNKGTGLGLSTVRGIVHNHNGFIKVYSQIGKGARFDVYLPAALDEKLSKIEEHPKQIYDGNGETILVVDDEESICNIAKTVLERHKYKVITAKDGVEALAIYAQNKNIIKVVLCDISMPMMDGISLSIALRKISKEIPIIMTSGLTTPTTSYKLENAPINAFIMKPFHTEELLEVLYRALHHPEELQLKDFLKTEEESGSET